MEGKRKGKIKEGKLRSKGKGKKEGKIRKQCRRKRSES